MEMCFNPPLCGLPFRTTVGRGAARWTRSFNPPLCGLPFRTFGGQAPSKFWLKFQSTPLWTALSDMLSHTARHFRRLVSIHPSVDCPFGLV